MTEEQFRVFEWHCKSSETITKVNILVKGYDKDASFKKYFWQDWPKHLQKSVNEVDDKHHNGYFQQEYNLYMEDE